MNLPTYYNSRDNPAAHHPTEFRSEDRAGALLVG